MKLRLPRPRFGIRSLVALVAIAALAFFAFLPPRPGTTDLVVGTGPEVRKGDSVRIHYVARLGGSRLSNWLGGGKEFDSSRAPGRMFFTFRVGEGMVIRDFDLGIVGMRAGGLRRIDIPPEGGYGSKGAPPAIPPDSSLVFEVELLKLWPGGSPEGSPR